MIDGRRAKCETVCEAGSTENILSRMPIDGDWCGHLKLKLHLTREREKRKKVVFRFNSCPRVEEF